MVYGETSYEPGWFDWAYKGVDHSFPGNGGVECRDFLSVSQRCWESLVATIVAIVALFFAYPRLRLPKPNPCVYHKKNEPVGRRILLLLMCLTFGIELGFKFATRQMIWIGNPCHLATMMQIFILAAPPSRIVTAAFRLQMHMLTGAPIAILFPVINTRLLPFETGVYFLQHVLMLIIPFYLMRIGDPFIPEPIKDLSWAFISFGFLFIYHFLPLQLLAYVSQVNLNNMLCPAVSDPFHGKFYRLFAICHQLILIPTLGKLFVIIARAFKIMPCNNPPDVANVNEAFFCEPACSCNSACCLPEAIKQDCVCLPTCDEVGYITDEDSGCVVSTSTTRCCCQLPKFDSLSTSCGKRRLSGSYKYSCPDSKPVNKCKTSCGYTQRLVNGELVTDSTVCCRRKKEGLYCQPEFSMCGSGNNCRSFLLNDSSQESSPEVALDQTLHVSELEQSRKSHSKMH